MTQPSLPPPNSFTSIYLYVPNETYFQECVSMIKWYFEEKIEFQGQFIITTQLNDIPTHQNDILCIYLGLHCIPSKQLSSVSFPTYYIVYQLKALEEHTHHDEDVIYFQCLSNANEVWDYSSFHIKILHNEYHIQQAIWVPLGHYPQLFKTIDMTQSKGNDICFVGQLNARRIELLRRLETDLGITIRRYTDTWGEERDNLEYHSGILLNLHSSETRTLEVRRLINALSHGGLIISETSVDKTLDEIYSPYVDFVDSYETLRSTLQKRIKQSSLERTRLAWRRLFQYRNAKQHEFSLKQSLWIQTHDTNSSTQEIQPSIWGDLVDTKNKSKNSTSYKGEFKTIPWSQQEDGQVIFPEVKSYQPDTMPCVSLVTPFYANSTNYKHRIALFRIVLRCFYRFQYIHDNLEWIILDDSPYPWLQLALPSQNQDPRIRYYHISTPKSETCPISKKRNQLVELARYQYIVHLDADDFYPPESIWNRIAILRSYRSKGYRCIGSHLFISYDIEKDTCHMYRTYHMPEATMAYTRDFWIDRQFANKDNNLGESVPFLQGRRNEVLSIPCHLNCITIQHAWNSTGNLRRYRNDDNNMDETSTKLKPSEFFSQYDQDFFLELYRQLYKS